VSSATIFAANTDTSSNAAANSIYTEDKLNIMVAPGQPEFTIKLKSNPSTGYSWFLREYDNTLITPVKHAFQQPTKGLIGAPGYETWVFRVKQAAFIVPQQTTIRMIYARPWQGSDSSTQTVFRVTIQGK
jgi:inhibitor of cysteine peptidase